MKKRYKIYITVVLIILIIAVICISIVHEKYKKNYTTITSVDGVEFDMPIELLTQATAITNMPKEMDYSSNTYSYKDGNNTYMLFNMEQFIIVVENQTGYRLRDVSDIEETMKANPLDGIWFEEVEKDTLHTKTSEDNVFKAVANVTSEISISNQHQGKFVGKFAYISENDYECSMFVGFKGESYNNIDTTKRKIMNYITRSLAVTEPASTLSSDFEDHLSKDAGLVIEDNQGEVGSNKYSDIYHLLSIGMTGLYHAYDKDAENSLSDGEITIEQLYTGNEAINIIKKYCTSGRAMHQYVDAPEGYTWHIIRYSLLKPQNELYTNIKVEGLDGEHLVYKGVSCTTRTYDIIYDWNSTSDLYCYYAVPNGCEEYMLECGDRYQSTSETACFRINHY